MAYDLSQDSNYSNIINALMKSLPGANQANIGAYTGQIGGDIDNFMSQFQNFVGRAPTQDEISKFENNWVIPNTDSLRQPGSQILANTPAAIQQFLGQNFQQEANQQAQQQNQTATQNALGQIPGIVQNQVGALSADLTNPNSPTYQSFSGLLNNMGITPSSGAFQAALGGTLGAAGAQDTANLLGQIGGGGLQAGQQLATAPYMNTLGNLYPMQQQYNNQAYDLENFGLESQLARQLANDSQPSGLQNALGYANAGSNIAKNLVTSGVQAQTTSYVCKELIKRGLICESDMDDFHVHIMPAMFKKGRAFWKYAMDGQELVEAANLVGIKWDKFKPLLFDRVMAEPDPCRAVDLYADACHQICIRACYTLWDPKVYRSSFLDSFRFFPKLFTYKPFLEALWKCVKVRMAFVYDKPRCEVHYGSR